MHDGEATNHAGNSDALMSSSPRALRSPISQQGKVDDSVC
jgi:hypothetical protein